LIASQLQNLLWFTLRFVGLEPTGPNDVFDTTLNNLAVDMRIATITFSGILGKMLFKIPKLDWWLQH
jgi:hypothetical protein